MTRRLTVAFFLCVLIGTARAQSPDHLSDDEIAAAVAAPPNTGFVYLEVYLSSSCAAQMPSESIFTPTGWLNAESRIAKQQYLPFRPSPDDTLRVLTIVSKGCAGGTSAGPACDTISRVALLSDIGGKVVVEAISQRPLAESWQNAYGASASCSALVSQFSLTIPHLLRMYTVKEKHIKKLGL